MKKEDIGMRQSICNIAAGSVEKTLDLAVDLSDTEAVMLQYPGISEAKAYVVNSKKYGKVPAATIVLQKDAEIDFEELKDYLEKRLIKVKRPVFIEKVIELPLI